MYTRECCQNEHKLNVVLVVCPSTQLLAIKSPTLKEKISKTLVHAICCGSFLINVRRHSATIAQEGMDIFFYDIHLLHGLLNPSSVLSTVP